jgi:hypothetical protein
MKRTPLIRRTLLAARTPLQRTKNAARKWRGSSSGKLIPPAPSEFAPGVKRIVRKRAGDGDVFDAACECCGKGIGEEGGEFQHRAARGSGGCRDTAINGVANCLLMCRECHRVAESRDPHLAMDAGGFWIEHGTTPEFDPRNVAVMWHARAGSGVLLFLAEDGIGDTGYGYSYSAPQAGVAEDGAS